MSHDVGGEPEVESDPAIFPVHGLKISKQEGKL